MKIKILRRSISHGSFFAKKDEIVEVPDHLGKAWVDAKFAELVPDSTADAQEVAKK
jgi:hypothetical protein